LEEEKSLQVEKNKKQVFKKGEERIEKENEAKKLDLVSQSVLTVKRQ